MSGKFFVWLLATVLLATASTTVAQESTKKIFRIGFVSGRSTPTAADPDPSAEAFRQGLRDLGYIEGKNLLIEYRYIEGKLDRVPSLVANLVQLKIDVLVSPTSPVIRAAKQATKTIPIVIVVTIDPVAEGLIDSLARPGGNVTGLTRLTRDLSGKRLELLKEAFPKILRVGLLWSPTPGMAAASEAYDAAARALKIEMQSLEVRGPNPKLAGAFRDAAKRRVNALVATRSVALIPYTREIADLALKNRLPSMFEDGEYVEAGGLMSYSANQLESFRRAATYVDKILKGRKPADLPVEQPMKFEFVINLKTAKQIGLTIPQSVLYRADRVIR